MFPERHLFTGGQKFLFTHSVVQKEQNTSQPPPFAAVTELTAAPQQSCGGRGKLLISGVAVNVLKHVFHAPG